MPESSFDSNKNYTKGANKIVNGLKTSKKSSSDDESDARKTRKSWRTRVKNGMIVKSKRNRNLRSNKRATLNVMEVDDPTDSIDKVSPQNDEQDDDRDVVVENIAERIKRRKENVEKETSKQNIESNTSKRSRASTRKKALSERRDESPATDHASTFEENVEVDAGHSGPRRTKRRKISRTAQSNTEDPERNEELSSDASGKASLRKSARNLTKISKTDDPISDPVSGSRNKSNSRFNYDSPPESSDETEECVPESNHIVEICDSELPSDKEAIEEQQRIERLLLQEREDFELARRLQAQFDEMERVAGRPRRTRKTTEGERSVLETTNAMGTVFKTNDERESNVAVKKKRGRPPKRVKIAVEDETRVR